MRALWKGFVSFGLVNFNIELHSAIQSQSLSFKLLHAKCKTPINYQRWCETCKTEVEWENVVKGYPLKDGSYYIITPENLEKIKPEKSEYINVLEFVDRDAVLPIYYDHHYYILEGDVLNKAYFLFMQALKDMNKCAIVRLILREKEHICVIQPYKEALLLSTLHYEYEIKKVVPVEARKETKIDKQELGLAQELINKLYHKKFDMSKYKETYHEELAKRIEAAAAGVALKKPAEKPKAPTPPSLLDALKKSISQMPKGESFNGIAESSKSRR